MPHIIVHTMQHLLSILMYLRKAGTDHMAIAPLILLIPLSLGWPLVIWLAGGRGSAAVSCLMITIWRAVSCARHGDHGPSTGAELS